VLSAGARTLCVGGDHSISLPILRAICKHRGGPVHLIQFDAHNDLWDEYFGSKYSHGTPFRRAFEEGLLQDAACSRSACAAKSTAKMTSTSLATTKSEW